MKTNRKIQLTWLGHSAFKFDSASGKTVLVDPWLDNPIAPANAAEISHAEAILITHGHSDHVGNAMKIAERTGAKIIAIYEVCLYLHSIGAANVMGMNKGGTIDLEGIKVTMVDAKHSSGIDVGGKVVAPGGEAAGYVIRFENGCTIYHAGDTSLFGDMRIIGGLYKPDVALLPIGGLYTMGPREAAVACDLLKPKKIIGMHYGTFPALAGTPQQLKKYLHTRMKSRVIELLPGISVAV